jgi:hypothetical protein
MIGLPTGDARSCPVDGTPCDLLQPDELQPHRLLLVCPDCGRWIAMAGFYAAADHHLTGPITWREEAHLFAPETATTAA